MEKSDCECVSPAMLLVGSARRRERDKKVADFDFLWGPVGLPWIDEGEHDRSSFCEVVRGSLN